MTLGYISNLILCLSYWISTLKGLDIKFNKQISGWHTMELIGFQSLLFVSASSHFSMQAPTAQYSLVFGGHSDIDPTLI